MGTMNQMTTTAAAFVSLAAAFSATAGGPSGGQYSIPWSTIDSGGVLNSSGGSYTLSGTIGQHDASGAISGGTYTLTGGFWAGVATAEPCLGDFNGNGGVDFDDLNTFISAFQTQNLIGDFNGNGGVDFDDLNTFILAFQTGCP